MRLCWIWASAIAGSLPAGTALAAPPEFAWGGEAVRLLVAGLGRRAGLSRIVRPHGLRHEAITAALDAGRDVRDVRKFSRHAKLDTVLVYDDNRADVAGDIARTVAGEDEGI